MPTCHPAQPFAILHMAPISSRRTPVKISTRTKRLDFCDRQKLDWAIFNSSVIGYKLSDYLNVSQTMLKTELNDAFLAPRAYGRVLRPQQARRVAGATGALCLRSQQLCRRTRRITAAITECARLQ